MLRTQVIFKSGKEGLHKYKRYILPFLASPCILWGWSLVEQRGLLIPFVAGSIPASSTFLIVPEDACNTLRRSQKPDRLIGLSNQKISSFQAEIKLKGVNLMANVISMDKKRMILSLLVEGSSIRSTSTPSEVAIVLIIGPYQLVLVCVVPIGLISLSQLCFSLFISVKITCQSVDTKFIHNLI